MTQHNHAMTTATVLRCACQHDQQRQWPICGIGALRNSDVFTAVRVIASDLATNPIEYSDKRISVLLNKAPNDHMTAWGFKFALAANMLLNGNSFARVTKNPSGQVTGFELVP